MEINETKKNIELDIKRLEDELKHCLKNYIKTTCLSLLENLNGLDGEVISLDNLDDEDISLDNLYEFIRYAIDCQEFCLKINGKRYGLKAALYYLSK